MTTDNKHILAILLTFTLAAGCDKEVDEDDGAAESDSGASETGATGLEIAGSYIETFMPMMTIAHEITDDSWTQTADFGTFVYTIDHYDNGAGFIVAQDESSTWNKLEWTYDDEMVLYYCQSAFAAASAQEAEAAPAADRTDPATAGCGGSFPWSRLDPT